MFGISKDRWYLKYGVHLISVIITFTAFFIAYLYSLSHEKEFLEIVSQELISYSKSKIFTFESILKEKSESVEKDAYNLFKIYNLHGLDTIRKEDPKVQNFYNDLNYKIEPDRLGFMVLENSSKKTIFLVNKNNYPIDNESESYDGYKGANGSIIWRNLLINTDYNLTMRIPIKNIKNKIIAHFRVGLKSDFLFNELNKPVILGDKKLSVLLMDLSTKKIIYSIQNDIVNTDFIKENTKLDFSQNDVEEVNVVKYKNGRDVILYTQKVQNSKWIAIFSLDTINLEKHIERSKSSVFIVALIFSLVTVLSIEILFRRIVKKLLKKLSGIQKQQVALDQLKEIVEMSILEVQFLINDNCIILAHNKNIQDVYGIFGSIVNTDFRELFIDTEKEKVYNNLIKKQEGDKDVFKSVCIRKDGTKFNTNIELETYSFLGKKYFYFFIQDITNLIEYENKINETERIYSTLLRNLPGIAYRCKNDENWTMEFLSDGCIELTGYFPEELVFNNVISYNDLILEEYRDEIFKITNEAIKTEKQFNFEYRILTKNKKIKWVSEKGIAIYDETGKPLYIEGFIADITEKKNFESNLLANTEKYLNIFENSAAGKSIMTVEGVFIEVNNSFCNMLGYSKEELIGQNYAIFTHPEDVIRSRNALKATLDNQNLNFHLVKRYLHKNGNVIYAKISLTMQYDKDKLPLYIITDVLDITTELKVKTELAESEERYKLLAESAQEGIFLLSKDYTLEFVNYYAAKIINPNTQPENLLNNKTHTSIFNIPNDVFKKAFNEKNIINVDSVVMIEGKKTYLETKLVPIIDEKNRVKSLLGVSRDETENRYLLEKLDESRTMLNTIINSVPQRIFWKDRKSIYLGCNLNFAQDGGLESVDEIIGKNDFELPWKDLADFYIEDDKTVMENSVTLLDKIESLTKADGSKVWISTCKVPLKNIMGETIGVLGIFEDVTEKKIIEEQLHETLYKLETSNKELEQFAYIASHDLQEPLRMVASYTQLLEQRYKNKLDEQADQYIYFAVDGAKRMQKLIDDLLDYSRVTTKGKELTIINLAEVMGKVMVALSSKIHETGAVIVNGNLPKVLGDETQIVRVFQNLLDNSIKYSGGKQPTIFINAEDNGDKYLLRVRDNGIGIQPEYKDRIFEIFERLHSTKDYPGTGIGLAICKRIVERHGGRIWLDESITEGAQFCFTLIKGKK